MLPTNGPLSCSLLMHEAAHMQICSKASLGLSQVLSVQIQSKSAMLSGFDSCMALISSCRLPSPLTLLMRSRLGCATHMSLARCRCGC